MRILLILACVLFQTSLLIVSNASAQPMSTTVGFDDGSRDGFGGNAIFEATGGNPGGNAHHLLEAFGIELRTGAIDGPSNPGFLGDYSEFTEIIFGVDAQVNSIMFGNSQVPRTLGLALVDRDIQGPNGPSGVFRAFGTISLADTSDWTNFQVAIDDPTQIELPTGWIGFGDEDPNTFEPVLPAGATFATVLAGVDELRITTFEPGFFYGFTNFDVRVDNISLQLDSIPEPASGLVIPIFFAYCARRRCQTRV